jgi:hypothetical protein
VKRWNIWIEDELLGKIKKKATRQGVSAAEWLREAGLQRLRREEAEKNALQQPKPALVETSDGR